MRRLGYFKVKDPNRTYEPRPHPPQDSGDEWYARMRERSYRITQTKPWSIDFGRIQFFDPNDRMSVSKAWAVALLAAGGKAKDISVFRRPTVSGPWDLVLEVGEWPATPTQEVA